MILLRIRRLWWSLYWCGIMRRRRGVGMCSFIELWMIGNWMRWWLLLSSCWPIFPPVRLETGWAGSWGQVGSLRFSIFIVGWGHRPLLSSLGNQFGGDLHSWYFKEERLLFIGLVLHVQMRWGISAVFCFIVGRLAGCGILFVNLLGLHEWFLKEWRIFCSGGGIGWGSILPIFGIWHHCVWCGIFGGRETGIPLRIWNARGATSQVFYRDFVWLVTSLGTHF